MNAAVPEYLTVREAASLLRVSVPTVRRWIRAGTIAAYRAGQRRLLLKRTDVTEAMRAIAPGAIANTGVAHSREAQPNPDASRRLSAGDRERRLRGPEQMPAKQINPGPAATNIMVPESWEEVRESRELRTGQVMGEDDPEFDQFDIGVVAHMIVHSPDRPRRRLLTPDEQRQWIAALERAQRTSDRIRKRSGVETFPPSEDIVAEMRDERIRQLTGDTDGSSGQDG